MFDPELSALVLAAVRRTETEIRRAAPSLADEVSAWLRELAGSGPVDAYFTHPRSFPTLLLPWWLAKGLRGELDIAFHGDLVYSTVNGTCYIRLIDNVMDGHATVEPRLLPAVAAFHLAFQSAYQPYFVHDHPFWQYLAAAWLGSAEATMRDAALTSIDHDQFAAISARKMRAARIPLAAVCHRYGCLDRLPAWEAFCDRLAAWAQMRDDLFDWHADHARSIQTYFLSEAVRRKRAGQSVTAWVIKEGFAWGVETLLRWTDDLHLAAQGLDNPYVSDYVRRAEAGLCSDHERVAGGLQGLGQIADLMETSEIGQPQKGAQS